jgi:hypothetical protein
MHRHVLRTWLLVNCRTLAEGVEAIRAMPHAGSCDMGPRPPGADTRVSLEARQRHGLGVMPVDARRLGVPVKVGS